MGNMRFKVGDRVRIKSIDWYNKNKDKNGYVDVGVLFDKEMSRWCGKTMTIIKVNQLYYTMEEDGISQFFWTDGTIECKVEEETKSKFKVGEIIYSTTWQRDVIILDILPDGFYKVGDGHLGWFRTDESGLRKEKITLPTDSQLKKPFKQEISLPEGYIFKDENGNVINATKIVLKKKETEYPKTYDECAKVLLDRASVRNDFGYKGELLVALQKLLVCRDTYWKIAGEEMGLGKPWEPDWSNQELPKYCIASVEGQIKTAERYIINTILAFPTAEMRDAFYENFKSEIEICKELL